MRWTIQDVWKKFIAIGIIINVPVKYGKMDIASSIILIPLRKEAQNQEKDRSKDGKTLNG